MIDVVDRLRGGENSLHSGHPSPLDREAADEIKRLRAEVRDWQENYKQAMDGRVALRAENTKLREALEKIAKPDPRYVFDVYDLAGIARSAIQKDEDE